MSQKLFVGIDTSNYTTSAALCTADGEVVQNIKIPLPVAQGARGLRQSDAVFHHVRQLPDAAGKLRMALSGMDGAYEIAAIGVSSRPRDAEDSYMPCFLAGVSAAETAGALLGVPVFHFSHQAGHVMAAVCSAGMETLIGGDFAAFHVSGGTTDVLLVRPHSEFVFAVEKIGGTLDINAGQSIDRAGVYMGLSFPAGAEMERLAAEYSGKVPAAHVSVHGMHCNLSGLENKAVRLYDESHNASLVSAFVLDSVAQTLVQMRNNLRKEYGEIPIVYAGGVMSCRRIANLLSDGWGYFAQPCFSSDNAAGAALLARYKYLHTEM